MLSAEFIIKSYKNPKCIHQVHQGKGSANGIVTRRSSKNKGERTCDANDNKFLSAIKNTDGMKKTQISELTGISYTALSACVTRLRKAKKISVNFKGNQKLGEETAIYSLTKGAEK